MPELDFEAALERLSAGEPAPLYVVAGSSEYIVSERARQLLERLTTGLAHDVRRFEEGASASEITTELLSMSLFSERVVVWIEGAGLLGGKPNLKSLWRALRQRLDARRPADGDDSQTASDLGLLEALAGACGLKLAKLKSAADPAAELGAAAGLKLGPADREDLTALLACKVKPEKPASPLGELLALAARGFSPHTVALVVAPGVSVGAPLAKEIAAGATFLRFDFELKSAAAAWDEVIAEACAGASVRLLPAARRALEERVEAGDLRRLAAEIGKLAAYAGPQGTISAAAVEELTTPGRNGGPFELADALRSRDLDRALEVLDRRLEAGDAALMLLGTIAGEVRSYCHIHARLDAGSLRGGMRFPGFQTRLLPRLSQGLLVKGEPAKVAAAAPVPDAFAAKHPWALFLAWEGACRYRPDELSKFYPRLFAADRALRGGDGKIVLESLLAALCRSPRPARHEPA